jgi:hypothetical protein
MIINQRDKGRQQPAALPDTSPRVSVIVPVYNGEHALPHLLKSLSSQTYSKDCFEVIVVDDGSTDSTIKVAQASDLTVTLITQEQKGSYYARNSGAAISTGTILAFTDADCLPTPSWLAAGVDVMLTQAADIVAGHVEMALQSLASPVEVYDASCWLRQEYYVREVGFGVTANLFVKRNVYDAVGGFPQRLWSGGDQKFCVAAVAGGARLVYARSAAIRHPARTTVRALRWKTLRVAQGRAIAFPNPRYLLPRSLSRIRSQYTHDRSHFTTLFHLRFALLHYYLELVRVTAYAVTRIRARWTLFGSTH